MEGFINYLGVRAATLASLYFDFEERLKVKKQVPATSVKPSFALMFGNGWEKKEMGGKNYSILL